jgi:diaminohydroxyphosphoribosylaminopyrimidine deaminase/5-amino-6-(5-phosphoribosylamino)uracil reductase
MSTAPPDAAPADAAHLRRTLALARQAEGRTSPNPAVGCVVVRGGQVLAEGFHTGPGRPHAEREALAALGGRAEGATLYVNLEPCCHHGRTPPCTEAVIAAGVARVVVGTVDPDPRVAGRGIAALRAAGIEVEVGVEAEACRSLNAPFFTARELGRPFVVLKAAATLDGRIASAFGESKWISGEEARAVGHRLRDTHDAVLVGAGTLHADDPSLDTRIPGGRNALPVVLDSGFSVRPEARVLHAGRRPLFFVAEDAPARPEIPADVERVPRGADGRLAVDAILAALHARDIQSVLVEGGGQVHRSLLDAGVADRVHLFLAPRVLAGGAGWLGGAPFHLRDAPAFRLVALDRVGPDAHLILEP